MESANLLEASLYCCCKCKGLFNIHDDKLKHQINCMGNPMETSCAYFACERKVFLQLFQPDDFLFDGCDQAFGFSKDDSFINHFVKIRVPDIFDPSIFLKSTTQPNQGDTDDTNFLLEPNINTLEEESEKTNGNSFLDSNKQVSPIDQEQIQSIINKNIEYLKNDNISSLSSGPSKVASPFHQSQSLPRLLSPIDKHLHLFGDGTKSRLQSPFEKNAGFLQDGQVDYSSGNFMYSSNPSLPFSCGLSTDLLSSIPPPPDENQQGFPTNIEEFPTLKYLDLAKKDPFFGQNPGLSQINTKDPFLINAAFKTAERPSFGLQKSQITRSCEDLQSSPMLPMQDGNYFNFPSTLDEPTQLDYLDLATLDFLTNPNFISFGSGVYKEKSYEKEEDIYSEGNLTDQEQRSAKSETAARLISVTVSDTGGVDGLSAFSKVKKKKLRLKKSKSDVGKRHENATSGNRSFFAGFPDIREDFQQSIIKSGDNLITVHPKGSRSLIDASGFRICRKRKLDIPKENNAKAKLIRMNRKSSESKRISKSEKSFNVREKLTHLTEDQKDSMKAVIGQSGCIFVKKKRSLSCDEPVVYVNDSQMFTGTNIFAGRSKFEEKIDKFQPVISNSKAVFDEQCKTGKLTSVLQLKCLECDFRCRSVVELKNHRVIHAKTKKIEPLAVEIPETITLQTTGSFIKDKTCSEMMQEGMNCSGMEMVTETSETSQLQNELNATFRDEGSVLLKADDLFTASVTPIESTDNVLIVSMCSPASSERCQSVFDKGVVICEATKEFLASQPKAVSLLPKKITDISANLPVYTLKEAYCESYHNSVNSVDSLTADMNKETAMAVQAIEDMNSECEDSPNEKNAISVQDAHLNGSAETENMVHDFKNSGVPKKEIHALNYELEAVHVENFEDDMNCNDKINFDFEFTSVPLQTYKTNVLSVDTGQSSIKAFKQDFVGRTETGKDINNVNEVTSQVLSQYGSDLNLIEHSLPLFEESNSAKYLKRETEGQKEQTQLDQIKVNSEVEFNDSVELKREYLNIAKLRTVTTMLRENLCIDNGSGGVKITELKISENVDVDQSQYVAVFKEDDSTQKCAKSTRSLDEIVDKLQCPSDEVSFETEKDEAIGKNVTEADCSETSSFHQTDKNLADKISQINEDSSEKLDLKDDNYWTTFVESIGNDNTTESTGGQESAVSVESKKLAIFNKLENISEHRVIDMDSKMTFQKNDEHMRTSLFSAKIDTNVVTELTCLYEEPALCDISGPRRESKPVQCFSSEQIESPSMELSHEVALQEGKGTDNGHVTLALRGSVEEQNSLACNNELMTVAEMSAVVGPNGMEFTVRSDKLDCEHVPVSKTNCATVMEMADVMEDSLSVSDLIQYSEKNEYSKVPTISEGESLDAFKTEGFFKKGIPCITEKNGNLDVAYGNSDIVSESDNFTEKGLKNSRTSTETWDVIEGESLQPSNSVCHEMNVVETTADFISTVTVTGCLNTSGAKSLPVTETQEVGVEKMQSLLTDNTFHVSSVTVQHINTTEDPAEKCASKSKDETSVKDMLHPESEVRSIEKNDENPLPEDHINQDSIKTDHLSSYFLTKDILGAGTKRQIKASDGAFHCDVKGCQFRTLYKSNVSAHYQQVHLALKRYICDQCTYATPNSSCLKHHMQLNHYKEKRFKCPDCDYLSLFHSDVVKHVRHTHMNQKQFACNQCKYRTGHSHSLKLHIMSHSGIRPYKCNTCDYRANSSNKVTRHITLCHKDREGVACEKQDLTFEIDAKQFQCEEVISNQDIKVIELTTEEANAIMMEKNEKKEKEKLKKDSEKKAKAEKKAVKVKKTAAIHNKRSQNTGSKTSPDVNVIRLTPEAAKALMEAKSDKKSSNCEETVKYTQVLLKPKSLLTCDTKVTRQLAEETSGFMKETNEKNVSKAGQRLKFELKSSASLQPRIIKMEIPSVAKKS